MEGGGVSDNIKVTISIHNGLVGCTLKRDVSFDREEWDWLTETEKDEACLEEVMNMIEWGYEVHDA